MSPGALLPGHQASGSLRHLVPMTRASTQCSYSYQTLRLVVPGLLAFGAVWTEEIVTERPAWRHIPSGVVFREVPGGTFRMGLSEAELAAVRAIERSGGAEDTLEPFFAGAGDAQPIREVRVEPFLLARHPLTVAQVRHWLPEYEDDYADADSGTARLEDDLDDLLEAMPFRLPSEAEWEYAARAGTTTLTFRGDGRPGEDQLLDDFGDGQRTAAAVKRVRAGRPGLGERNLRRYVDSRFCGRPGGCPPTHR